MTLESFGSWLTPPSVYSVGIAQWPWYKTGRSEPLALGRGHQHLKKKKKKKGLP